jgi:Predicted acyltransferase
MSRAWINLPERGSTGALAAINWVATAIGRGAGRALLYPIVLYFLITARRPREASRLYLRRVLAREPRTIDIFRHIHCFAATILDRPFLLGGQLEKFDIRVHDGHIISDHVGAERGCILLGSHLGSFEALRVLAVTNRHFPLKVLMNVDHNPAITRFFNALNPEIADTIICIRGPNTLIEVKEWLDKGYLIGTLGDRVVADERTLSCRFLGSDAAFPQGPFQMAAILQCPIVLAFSLYRGGNRYDVHFELLSSEIPVAARRRPEALRVWAQLYADRLEHFAREAPLNWFNFYDFWGEASPGHDVPLQSDEPSSHAGPRH